MSVFLHSIIITSLQLVVGPLILFSRSLFIFQLSFFNIQNKQFHCLTYGYFHFCEAVVTAIFSQATDFPPFIFLHLQHFFSICILLSVFSFLTLSNTDSPQSLSRKFISTASSICLNGCVISYDSASEIWSDHYLAYQMFCISRHA